MSEGRPFRFLEGFALSESDVQRLFAFADFALRHQQQSDIGLVYGRAREFHLLEDDRDVSMQRQIETIQSLVARRDALLTPLPPAPAPTHLIGSSRQQHGAASRPLDYRHTQTYTTQAVPSQQLQPLLQIRDRGTQHHHSQQQGRSQRQPYSTHDPDIGSSSYLAQRGHQQGGWQVPVVPPMLTLPTMLPTYPGLQQRGWQPTAIPPMLPLPTIPPVHPGIQQVSRHQNTGPSRQDATAPTAALPPRDRDLIPVFQQRSRHIRPAPQSDFTTPVRVSQLDGMQRWRTTFFRHDQDPVDPSRIYRIEPDNYMWSHLRMDRDQRLDMEAILIVDPNIYETILIFFGLDRPSDWHQLNSEIIRNLTNRFRPLFSDQRITRALLHQAGLWTFGEERWFYFVERYFRYGNQESPWRIMARVEADMMTARRTGIPMQLPRPTLEQTGGLVPRPQVASQGTARLDDPALPGRAQETPRSVPLTVTGEQTVALAHRHQVEGPTSNQPTATPASRVDKQSGRHQEGRRHQHQSMSYGDPASAFSNVFKIVGRGPRRYSLLRRPDASFMPAHTQSAQQPWSSRVSFVGRRVRRRHTI